MKRDRTKEDQQTTEQQQEMPRKNPLTRAVSHREFLKMCGLALVGAGTGQMVVPPKPAVAYTYLEDLTIEDSDPDLTLHRTANNQLARILFQNSTNNYVAAIQITPTVNPDISIKTGNNANPSSLPTRVTIQNNGNVGIGTTSPPVIFSVNGIAGLAETTAPVGGVSGYGQLYVKSSDSKLYFMGDDGVEHDLLAAGEGGGGTPGGSDGLIQYNNGGVFGGASSLFYDDALGRLGIGTATPGERLEVAGNVLVNGEMRVNGLLAINSSGIATQCYYAA